MLPTCVVMSVSYLFLTEQHRNTTRGSIDTHQFDAEHSSYSHSDSADDDWFTEPSPPAKDHISSKYASLRSSSFGDSRSMSSQSSRMGQISQSRSLDEEDMAEKRKLRDQDRKEVEDENDEVDLWANAPPAFYLQQKELARQAEYASLRQDKDSKYNEPAPFWRNIPPMHSFEKHPLSSNSRAYGKGKDVAPKISKESLKVDSVIQRFKKQLNPINYSGFWFTIEQTDAALDFSNSVRRCITRTGTFGAETERLNRWLNVMMLEAKGPHRLEFELVREAHLDKMIEEIVEFKSRPATLPFKELQMIEIASDLLRYWRHRFGSRYYTIDRYRQQFVMEMMLEDLQFRLPRPVRPLGWKPLKINWLSEYEADRVFEEGLW